MQVDRGHFPILRFGSEPLDYSPHFFSPPSLFFFLGRASKKNTKGEEREKRERERREIGRGREREGKGEKKEEETKRKKRGRGKKPGGGRKSFSFL